ncbi:MAG TPA: hypothetical protein VGH54_09485 [Mycobacterium sp.]|jgi:hypothetical protein|uniref:hypothetical protein n=1 Tax=Mycobacterium sp. TaxID=1785 RepID=UPI002F42F01F
MRDLIGITYDAGSSGPELTATEWRLTDTSLFLRDTTDVVMGGVRGGAVTNTGSSVTIAPLTVVVQTLASLGVYRAAFPGGSSELSKTLAAAHATLSRIDALDVKIYDHEADGSGLRGADIVLTTGTPGSGSAPAFTGVGIRLGTFNVPAAGGASPAFTANANLVGYAAAGGILDIAARPSNPRPGAVIYNRSTGVLEVFHSSAWRNIMSSVWTNWVPSWTGTTQDPQRGNGVEAGAYRISGGMVDAFWKYTYGTAFVVGAGLWAWTMPVAAASDWAIGSVGRTAFNDVSAGACLTRNAVTLGQPASFAAVSEAGVRLGPAGPVPDTGDTLAITLRFRPANETP